MYCVMLWLYTRIYVQIIFCYNGDSNSRIVTHAHNVPYQAELQLGDDAVVDTFTLKLSTYVLISFSQSLIGYTVISDHLVIICIFLLHCIYCLAFQQGHLWAWCMMYNILCMHASSALTSVEFYYFLLFMFLVWHNACYNKFHHLPQLLITCLAFSIADLLILVHFFV